MISLLSHCLLFAGSALILIATLGLVKMPDIFMRMHAATKAGTLGAGLIFLGTMIRFSMWVVTIKMTVAIIFLVISAPVAFHLIARAVYHHGVRLYPDTKRLDEKL